MVASVADAVVLLVLPVPEMALGCAVLAVVFCDYLKAELAIQELRLVGIDRASAVP